MEFWQAAVIRQLSAGNAEEARLKELIALSGALPGEVEIVWVFLRAKGGAWPRLK